MENQNILRIVLCLAILAAFFLPLYNDTIYGATLSAIQILTGGFKTVTGTKGLPTSHVVLMICLLIVLICTSVIFVSSILRRATSVFLNLLPLLAIIGLIIFSMLGAKENVGQALQTFGTGFYIMFLSSFLLPFTSIAVPTPTKT